MDRRKLSLDFNQTRKVPRATFQEYNPTIHSAPRNDVTNLVSNTTPIASTILPSPDFKGNLFSLTSPDHIFLPITPIPTPVYLANSSLTESDHEAYVKGFLDAIVELQRQNVTKLWSPSQPAIPSFVALTPVSPYKPLFDGIEKSPFITASASVESCNSTPINLTTSDKNLKHMIPNPVQQQPPSILSPMNTPQEESKSFNSISSASFYSPLSSPTSSNHQPMKYESDSDTSSINNTQHTNISHIIKKQPHNTSNSSINNSTPSSSSTNNFEKVTNTDQAFLNKEGRELARLARRREKNRNAARKCRTKKLERISCLEERVRQLKNENQQLLVNLDKNKHDVFNLQKNLSNHINQKECKLFPDGKTLV